MNIFNCVIIATEIINRMIFLGSYQNIIACIHPDLKVLDENLYKILKEKENDLTGKLEKYLFSKSKRIRSVLIFLFSRAIDFKETDKAYKLAAVTELIHNATLIHDDVIDDSDVRRGETTLNYEFDADLAVVAGDFLLSIALEEILSINCSDVIKIFAKSLRKLCEGEISQYFNKNKKTSLDEYINKSEQKTATLFKAALLALDAVNGHKNTEQICKFATNFGIAFQIRDDLLNIIEIDKSKPIFNDIKSGIYTAPVLFYLQEQGETPEEITDKLLNDIRNSCAIEKTKQLIHKHITLAIDSLDFLQDNLYKQSILKLCKYISEDEKSES